MIRKLGWFVAAGALVTSCADFPTYTAVSDIAPPAGQPTVIPEPVAGSTVPIAVVISGEGARPLANVVVTFAPGANSGTVSAATATTGADGRASINWTLHPKVGTNNLTASAEGRSIQFTAATKAGAASKLVIEAGDGQTAKVASALPNPLRVRVTDVNENLVGSAAVAVLFRVTAGNGRFPGAQTSLTVNAQAGVAQLAGWTLGNTAGAANNEVTVTSTALPGATVVFKATATAGDPAIVTFLTGNNVQGFAGSRVTPDPRVKVTDAFGNAISGAEVSFAASGTGTVVPARANTNDAGEAATAWTLSRTAGANTLSASVVATPANLVANLAATGNVGAAARIALVAGSGQSAPAGSVVAVRPAVKVTDANDNAVTGVSVTFAVTGGGGRVIGPTTVVSGTDGVATVGGWELGATRGVNTLTATSGTLQGSPVTFTAQATQVPASIEKVTGDNQTAVAGTPVATPPSVRVRDALGNAVEGATVTFVATGPGTGATVAPTTVTTGADGIAAVTGWSLGRTVGANSLAASVSGAPPATFTATFTATGVAGPAAKLALIAGNNQSGPASAALSIAPSVKVSDANDNAVAGASVVFAVTGGGGSVKATANGAPAASVTVASDAQGIAALHSWILGPVRGPNALEATSGTLQGSPVAFSAQATQVPATIEKVAGDNQTAIAGTPVAVPPVVRVKDALGNPVEGATVTFVAAGPGTGAIVAPTTVSTGANGQATVTGWSLGRTAGANTLIATVGGTPPATFSTTFNATGTAGSAAKIVLNAGNNQSAPASTAVPVAPSVKVTDANDNAVAGTAVVFTVTAGGGTTAPASPASINTNAQGIAALTSWTLGPAQGTNNNTLTATSTGLMGSPITFVASATQTPTSLSVNAGQGQTAIAGATVTTAPSVVVRDGSNNPVANVNVRFTVTGGGGSLNPASPAVVATNASGIATVVSWTLGTTAGANTLLAEIVSNTALNVTFTASGVAGPPAKLVRNSTDPQTGTINSAVGSAPSVLVTDSNDNPVGAGTNVTFTVTSGAGTTTPASPATVATNAQGVASLTAWVLGSAAGANTVDATSGSLQGSPMTFTATANGPATIIANSSTTLTGTVASTVAPSPSVLVRDINNNPVPGVNVNFVVTGGGGSVTGSTAIPTNASGVATVGGWVLGTVAGSSNNTLNASSGGVGGSPVTFTATATAGAATQLVVDGTNPTAGAPIDSLTLGVFVRDTHGNGVSGETVTFAVTAGNGAVVATGGTTNASGRTTATWRLGPQNGTHTLTATRAGLGGSPLAMNATVTGAVGVPTYIAALAGNSSSGSAGVVVPLGIRLYDATNATVGTYPIASWQVTGGTLNNSNTQTGPLGTATTQLTPVLGLNTVTVLVNANGKSLTLTINFTGT